VAAALTSTEATAPDSVHGFFEVPGMQMMGLSLATGLVGSLSVEVPAGLSGRVKGDMQGYPGLALLVLVKSAKAAKGMRVRVSGSLALEGVGYGVIA